MNLPLSLAGTRRGPRAGSCRRGLVWLCCLLGLLLCLAAVGGSGSRAAPAEELTPKQRQELETRARKLHGEGVELLRAGQYADAVRKLEQAVALFQRLDPEPNADLAVALNTLGLALLEGGEPLQAQPHLEQSLKMMQRLYPPEKYPDGHADLVLGLHNLGFVYRKLGDYDRAL